MWKNNQSKATTTEATTTEATLIADANVTLVENTTEEKDLISLLPTEDITTAEEDITTAEKDIVANSIIHNEWETLKETLQKLLEKVKADHNFIFQGLFVMYLEDMISKTK